MSHSHRDSTHRTIWIQRRTRYRVDLLSRLVCVFIEFAKQIPYRVPIPPVYGFDIGLATQIDSPAIFMLLFGQWNKVSRNCLLQIRKITKSVWSENISSSFSIENTCDDASAIYVRMWHTVRLRCIESTHTQRKRCHRYARTLRSRRREEHDKNTHRRCVYVTVYGMLTMRFFIIHTQQTTNVCFFSSSRRFVALFVSSHQLIIDCVLEYSILSVSLSHSLQSPIQLITWYSRSHYTFHDHSQCG